MRNNRVWRLLLVAAIAAGVAGVAACDQGLRERCQVNADCDDGLVCNQGQTPPRCEPAAFGNIDAAAPPDAPPADAAPDAPPDAPPDAT